MTTHTVPAPVATPIVAPEGPFASFHTGHVVFDLRSMGLPVRQLSMLEEAAYWAEAARLEVIYLSNSDAPEEAVNAATSRWNAAFACLWGIGRCQAEEGNRAEQERTGSDVYPYSTGEIVDEVSAHVARFWGDIRRIGLA